MTIKSQTEYEQALEELWSLWDSPPNSPEQARFVELCQLVDNYEREHFNIPAPSYSTTNTIMYVVSLIMIIIGMLTSFALLMISIGSRNFIAIIISGLLLFVASKLSNKTLQYMLDDLNDRKR